MGLYVYALTDGIPTRLGRGLGGERLRAVELGWGFALGEPMAEPPPVVATTLRAHDAVVRRLARQVEAVLPCRFGSVVDDAGELARALAPRRRALGSALARVRGLQQVTVRIFDDRAAPRPAPPAKKGADAGTRYLLEALRTRDRRVALLEPLRAAVAGEARGEIVEEHAIAPLVATIHHLVARGRAPAYRALLRGAALVPHVRLVVRGPLPPYAFSTEWLA